MKYYAKQYKNKKYDAKRYITIGSTTHNDTRLNVIE